MKKLICLCLATFLLLANLPAARADVIFEPWDDDFFQEHRTECDYHDRNYTTEGPNGDVTIYESPISDRVINTVKNGEAIWIAYIYEGSDGIQWGYTTSTLYGDGWVPMAYLSLIYDYICFEEEYGHTFKMEEGELDEKWNGKEIYCWEYPGSFEAIPMTVQENHAPSYDCIYVDGNGNRWGRINYYYGYKHVWIALDDPDADFETLYPNGVGVPTQPVKPIDLEEEDEIKPKPAFNTTVVVICVVAVVAISALLLFLLKRKR